MFSQDPTDKQRDSTFLNFYNTMEMLRRWIVMMVLRISIRERGRVLLLMKRRAERKDLSKGPAQNWTYPDISMDYPFSTILVVFSTGFSFLMENSKVAAIKLS